MKNLNPNFVTGFADGESSFIISVTQKSQYKTGWLVYAAFQIALPEKDRALLELIQGFFGVGKINKRGKDSIQYRVSSIKDLAVIKNHFDKYPLITQKRADFELFKSVVELMNKGEHLTEEGLRKIVAIKASMNLGLPNELKEAFPDITLVSRPVVEDQKIQDPNWLAGFTAGEGNFLINTIESTSHKTGAQIQLRFQITQHSRDAELMKSLVSYLGCGRYKLRSRSKSSEGNAGDYIVTRFADHIEKIIPLFNKYPLRGIKSLDFADFSKVAFIMKAKGHLTQSGLEEIRLIKAGMNKGRKS